MATRKKDCVRVRMLASWPVEGVSYACGQVVDFPIALAIALEDAGKADSTKEAVDYALQFTKPVEHKLPDVQKEDESEAEDAG